MESIIQSQIGHTIWGLYSAINSLAIILAIVLNPGFSQLLASEAAKNKKKNLLLSLLSVQHYLSPIFLILLYLFSTFIGNSNQHLRIVLLLAALLTTTNYIGTLRSNIQGKQLYKIDLWFSNLDKMFFVFVISYALLIGMPITIEKFLITKTGSLLISFFLLTIYHLKKDLFKRSNKKNYSLVNIYRLTLPFAAVLLLNSLHERIDMVLLYILTNSKSTSIYSASYRIYEAILMFYWIVGPYFLSRISFHHRNHQKQLKMLKNGTTLLLVPTIYLFCFSVFHGKLLFVMFNNSPSDQEEMKTLLLLLFLPIILNGVCVLPVAYMFSKKTFKPIILSTSAAILLNLTLNIIFLPKYGTKAAAITTGISSAFMSATYLYHNRKTFYLEINYWLKIVTVSIVCYLSFAIGKKLDAHIIVTSLFSVATVLLSTYFLEIIPNDRHQLR